MQCCRSSDGTADRTRLPKRLHPCRWRRTRRSRGHRRAAVPQLVELNGKCCSGKCCWTDGDAGGALRGRRRRRGPSRRCCGCSRTSAPRSSICGRCAATGSGGRRVAQRPAAAGRAASVCAVVNDRTCVPMARAVRSLLQWCTPRVRVFHACTDQPANRRQNGGRFKDQARESAQHGPQGCAAAGGAPRSAHGLVCSM